jgi:integrase
MPVPFPRFVLAVLAVYDGPGHSPRTRAKMRHVLDLVERLGVATTADLTTELAALFVRERSGTVGPNTIRGELAYLSAACGFALEEGWLERPPRWSRVRPRAAPGTRPRVHAIADVARVLELLRGRSGSWEGGRLHAMTAVAAYAALRRDEVLYLQGTDVDLATGLLRVVARHRLKTEASAADVPIAPELRAILAGWMPRCGSPWLFPGIRRRDRPWTGGACGDRPCDHLRRAGEELGIAGLTFQSLRHSFATWATRRWGLSPIELQDVLRHTSPATARWYIHPDPDPAAIVRSVARVSYACG